MSTWYEQWKLFSPNFRDGAAHIDLSAYGLKDQLKLKPGPGFGDYSHPTTRMTLKLMACCLVSKHVIDIGCGSGILSLAACKLGALSVYGYDIDPDAVKHAQENGFINSLSITFSQQPPQKTPPGSVILLNMIFTEQAQAWDHFKASLSGPCDLFTSGVLTSHEDAYLHWASSQRWILKSKIQEGEWMAFHFLTSF